MYTSKIKAMLSILVATFVVATGPVSADDSVPILGPGTYELHNHPDGNAASPFYGLRLDELINVTGGHDIFTFDFDHALSNMTLELTATTARISGTVFGGLDTGSSYDPANSGLWAVDFFYGDLVSLVPGDNDFVDVTDNDSGSISQLFGAGSTFDFHSYHGFHLGDTDDDSGYRDFDGVSGWGWLSYDDENYIGASDWLFTVGDQAVGVPEPQTYLTLGAFMLFAVVAKRRRALEKTVA